MKKLVTVLACTAMLAGCSSISPTPDQPDYPDTYRSVEELRDAFVRAGGACDEWEQSNRVTAASESGTCSDSNVLSVYSSQDDRDQVVDSLREFSTTIGGMNLLVGENWIVNDPAVKNLDPAMGGVLVTK